MHDVPRQFVGVAAWVDSNQADPVAHRRRQAKHILLNAIAAIHPTYSLYLKGGLLLGLVHRSPRMTIDIDLTAGFSAPANVDDEVRKALDNALRSGSVMSGRGSRWKGYRQCPATLTSRELTSLP